MRSGAKVLLTALAALTALMIAALVVVRFVDLGRYRDRITTPLTELTGREVRIDGGIHIHPGLSMRLVAEGVSFGNADWGSRHEMVTVNRVAGALRLLPLLRGKIEVAGVVIEGLDLLVERNDAGVGNWEFDRGKSEETPTAPGPRPLPPIERLEVRNARVAYHDAAANRPMVLNLQRLELRAPAADSPIEIALEAEFQGARVVVDGKSSPIADWALGDTWPAADGNLELSAAEPAVAAASLGVDIQALPAAKLSAGVGLANRTLALRDIDARIGASDSSGGLSLSWAGDRPQLIGALKSKHLYLEELFPESGRKSNSGGKHGAAALVPLPWHLLAIADLDVSVAIESLHVRTGGAAGDVLLKARLDDGTLDVSSRIGSVGRGSAKANLHAEGKKKRVDLELQATDISIENLLSGDTIRGATASAEAQLSGHGTSRQSLARALDGNVLVEVAGGTFSGPFIDLIAGDLLGQVIDRINPTARKSGPTRLDCAVVKARVRKGVVEFDKGLALETEKVKVIGAGTLELGTGKIDLAARTDPKGATGVSIAAMVDSLIRIRGTIAKPDVEIDPLGAASAPLRVGGAVMTGALSMLGQAALGRSGADVSPCLIARGMGPKEKSATDSVADTATTVGKAVSKGASSAGRGLKKLFGR